MIRYMECYVIGLEPTAADAKFEATIEMVEGVPKVTWSPDLGAEREYRVLGAKGLVLPVREDTDGTGLGGAAFGCVASLGCSGETHGLRLRRPNGLGSGGTVWEVVTEETEGDYNFFKVVVEMP